MTEKRTKTVGTFMRAQGESEINCTKYIKQAWPRIRQPPCFSISTWILGCLLCDASRLDPPPKDFLFGMFFDWRFRMEHVKWVV